MQKASFLCGVHLLVQYLPPCLLTDLVDSIWVVLWVEVVETVVLVSQTESVKFSDALFHYWQWWVKPPWGEKNKYISEMINKLSLSLVESYFQRPWQVIPDDLKGFSAVPKHCLPNIHSCPLLETFGFEECILCFWCSRGWHCKTHFVQCWPLWCLRSSTDRCLTVTVWEVVSIPI